MAWIIGGCVLVGGFCYFGWTLSKIARSQVMAAVEFEDGARLEVIGTSIGNRTAHFTRRWPKIPFWGFSHHHDFQINDPPFEINRDLDDEGWVIMCHASARSPTAMLLELRLREGNGAPLVQPMHLLENGGVRFERNLGDEDHMRSHDYPVEDESGWSNAMQNSGLKLLVQHRDPHAGWIHLTGPFLLTVQHKDRYIVVLNAWQRNLQTLDFRAIRADGSISEFSLPNPDYQPAPPVHSAKPAPLVHQAADYKLTLRSVKRVPEQGKHPSAVFELDLESPLTPPNSERPLALELGGCEAEDEWGNRSLLDPFDHWRINGHINSATIPVGARRAGVTLKVYRTGSYPRLASAGVPVLAGEVRADGKSVDFSLLPDATRMGVSVPSEVTTNPVYSHKAGEWPKDWLCLKATAGEDSATGKGARPGNWEYVVFPEDSSESAGFCYTAHHSWMAWHTPPALLRPGARFRIAIHEELPYDEVKFDVELPAE